MVSINLDGLTLKVVVHFKSGSIDNFKIESSDHDLTGSAFHDNKWEANFNTIQVVEHGSHHHLVRTHYTQSFTKTDNLNVPLRHM